MSQSTTEHVAAQVRAEMARQRTTAQQLAVELGVSEMWVSRRTRAVTAFAVSDLVRVAEVLDVPVSQFLPAAPQRASVA